MKKVDEYLKQLDTMANEEEKNWLVNEYGPYINKLKAVAEAKKAAAEQTAKGLDSIGGGGAGGQGMFGKGASFTGGGQGAVSGASWNEYSVGTDGGWYPNYPSDKRLKHNYSIIGKSPSGLNIYAFSYLGSYVRWQGVMANEVPYAAQVGPDGYLWVDYSLIDVEFKQL